MGESLFCGKAANFFSALTWSPRHRSRLRSGLVLLKRLRRHSEYARVKPKSVQRCAFISDPSKAEYLFWLVISHAWAKSETPLNTYLTPPSPPMLWFVLCNRHRLSRMVDQNFIACDSRPRRRDKSVKRICDAKSEDGFNIFIGWIARYACKNVTAIGKIRTQLFSNRWQNHSPQRNFTS